MFENFVIPDFLPAAPEMFLAIMAMTILMIDLFAKDARHSIAFWLAQLTLLGCAFIQVYTSTPGVVTPSAIPSLMTAWAICSRSLSI